MHDAAGLQRICLLDLDARGVVKCAEHGEVVVFDVVHKRLEQRQEEAFGCLTQVVVFLRRQTDNGCRINSFAAMCDGGDFKQRVAIGHGVETGVIAEWAFENCAGAKRLAGAWVEADETCIAINETFDHDLCVCGDPERNRFGADHFYAAAIEEACEQEFRDSWWQWRSCGVGQHTFAAKDYCNRHALAEFFPASPVRCAIVMHVPVHRQILFAKELDAVHADVVRGRFWVVDVVCVNGVDAGEGDVAAAEMGVPVWAGGETGDVVVDA